MLYPVQAHQDLKKIAPFFNDIRFFMGNSVLDGMMGTAYVDHPTHPKIAFLQVRNYCFMSGIIEKENLKVVLEQNFSDNIFIPSNNISKILEELYPNQLIKKERYSLKKDVIFDIPKLEHMASLLPKEIVICKIEENLAKRIKKEKFINITDDYKTYGVGFCCMHQNEIIGVASSSIYYSDGIEVNIKVKEAYRKQGIATAMASHLILECIKQKKKVSWDAANLHSLGLAEKLGFEYDSAYSIYQFYSP